MKTNKQYKSPKIASSFIGVVIILACLLVILRLSNQNSSLKKEINVQQQKIEELTQLSESAEKCNLLILLDDTFKKIEAELVGNQKRTLSSKTIEELVELNASFQSDKDDLSSSMWSMEKGHFLKKLASLNLDSVSFHQIISKASFHGANMKGMNLKGLDLSGVDLKNANLKEADLSHTNLSGANLSDANLWGAKLQKSKLTNTILHRADLQWADMAEADLSRANLNGANLNDAKMGKANFQSTNLEWAKVENAYLEGADFINANLTGTDFGNSNLTKVKFTNSIMNIVNLSDAILDQTELTDAALSKLTVLGEDWIEKLKEKKVVGHKEIAAEYKIIVEPSGKFNFRLVKK